FLDEVLEFDKYTLEAMRQPLEDGVITVSRLSGSITYPAEITLILTGNPCPCGYRNDDTKKCTCSYNEVKNYLSKLSGPLLDRIDLYVEAIPVKYKELNSMGGGEKSSLIRERVIKARDIQLERFKDHNIFSNSQLSSALVKKFCKLDSKGNALLKSAFEKLDLSARAYNRILKVARTIADLDGSEDIKSAHIAEAIQYRVTAIHKRVY
ncbi:MAG: ATP-binding protein, partial [Clostridiaceae bacterium]|nr:ATP-binding protein [Clostridiaceae bacterium]